MPERDTLRGIAVLGVMCLHAFFWQYASYSFGQWGRLILNLTRPGWIGVNLFFVLSGFLITGILLDSQGSPHYFRSFYIRRVLRLFPVYYGFLIVMIFVVPAIHQVAQLHVPEYHGSWWWYILYFSNWKMNHDADASLGHFWSLALEEQFYFFWPLTVYLLPRRALAWWCGVLCAIAVGMRHTLVGKGIDLYAITPSRMDALVIGALMALAIRDTIWRERLIRYRKILGLLTLAGFVGFVQWNWRFPWNPWSAFFAAAWFGVLVFQGATHDYGPIYGILNRPLLRNYGKYSYCIYVIHLVFLDHVKWLSGSLMSNRMPIAGLLLIVLVILAANVVIYWVARTSWQYYEAPILRLKDRLAPV